MRKRDAILAVGNSPVLTLLAVAAFAWLGFASQQWQQEKEHGYEQRDIDAVGRLLDDKPLDKRAAIMDVWQLSEADVAKPVDFFMEE